MLNFLSTNSVTILADNWNLPDSNVVTITGVDDFFAGQKKNLEKKLIKKSMEKFV